MLQENRVTDSYSVSQSWARENTFIGMHMVGSSIIIYHKFYQSALVYASCT